MHAILFQEDAYTTSAVYEVGMAPTNGVRTSAKSNTTAKTSCNVFQQTLLPQYNLFICFANAANLNWHVTCY